MKLKDKVAIVTGASRGIGRAIALAFAREGANVVINFRTRDDLAEEVVSKIKKFGQKALKVQADVRNLEEVNEMVELVIKEFGRIDILVNNAGIGGPAKPIEEVTDEEWEKIMDINLKGVFYCCKAVVPYMRKQGSGKIINISSVSGRRGSMNASLPYCVSKAGVIALTYSLAYQLGEYNITVNAVAPGATLTDMLLETVPPDRIKAIEQGTPLKRLGTPEEVAHAVVFLAENDFITAEVILVCGGRVPG